MFLLNVAAFSEFSESKRKIYVFELKALNIVESQSECRKIKNLPRSNIVSVPQRSPLLQKKWTKSQCPSYVVYLRDF